MEKSPSIEVHRVTDPLKKKKKKKNLRSTLKDYWILFHEERVNEVLLVLQ